MSQGAFFPTWLYSGYFEDPLSQLQYAIEDPTVPLERVIELAETRAWIQLGRP